MAARGTLLKDFHSPTLRNAAAPASRRSGVPPLAVPTVECGNVQIGRFQAMGCPCEILFDTRDAALAGRQLQLAIQEANRIEAKYSRYQANTIVEEINASAGKKVKVDDETAALLDFAAECYRLSDGLFDITTGVLRKIWRFDSTEVTISPEAIEGLRNRVGWSKVKWERPFIELPAGFEIDLGGICKEYAADQILRLLRNAQPIATLVNLGGDIAAEGERRWSVGIENISQAGDVREAVLISRGGLATSGTTKRFVRVNGAVFSHILNPKTGWPVRQAPQSVTVTAKTCTEAGFWSTLAVLHGAQAEAFLSEHSVAFRCHRA